MLKNLCVRTKLFVLLLIPVGVLITDMVGSALDNYREMDAMNAAAHIVALSVAGNDTIHELQKERGISVGYTSSKGASFAADLREQRRATVAAHRALAEQIASFVAEQPSSALNSSFRGMLQRLDNLDRLRSSIDAFNVPVKDVIAEYTGTIKELRHILDEILQYSESAAMYAKTANFLELVAAKEFAGQERATGATAFGAGVSDATRQQHWLHLIDSQDRCFKVFADFSQPAPLALWHTLCAADGTLAELERLRRIGCTAAVGDALDAELSQVWFDCCTRRMDAMQSVEAHMAADLLRLCESKVTEARTALQSHQTLLDTLAQTSAPPTPASTAPSAAFFDTPPAAGVAPPPQGYGLHLDRSVLELVQEQSQRLQAMRDELDTVRATLNERKLVERAKGLLMAHRQLSEGDAHKLLRQTAMNQNRRLVEVAEAVLATADLLPPK